MPRHTRMPLLRLAFAAAAGAAALALLAIRGSAPIAAGGLEAGVQGPKACQECHGPEYSAWEKTHHFASGELHRSDKAKAIADKLGLESIRKSDLCQQCHYTVREDAGEVRAKEGVSCESCHGPAQGWVAVHNNYGGEGVKRDAEPAEHKAARWKASEEAGMIRPNRLYDLARNCLSCHTVPDEKLVNVGGHTAGTPFELVSWSQGEVRHNYTDPATGKPDANNREATPERKRQMYVLGKIADLEITLRAMALATDAKGVYFTTLATRVADVKKALGAIQAAQALPAVAQALAAVEGLDLSAPNADALNAVADKLTAAAGTLPDDAALEKLDPLLPKDVKGTPAQ